MFTREVYFTSTYLYFENCVSPNQEVKGKEKLTQIPRHLIISSDIATWKFDRPVLFLGKWCLREQDRAIWETMDAVVADPVGAKSQDKYALHLEARRLEIALFSGFVNILNEHHGVEREERYWKILLGHWFRETIELLINRIVTIERCYENYQISGATLYHQQVRFLAAANYSDSKDKANNNCWDSQIFERLLKLLDIPNEGIEYLTHEDVKNVPVAIPNRKITIKQQLFKNARRIANEMACKKDAFIVNSYLPLQKEFLLGLALGQCPQWRFPLSFETSTEVDTDTRTALGHKMRQSDDTKLERAIACLIFDLIPICYLEEYSSLVRVSELVRWPKEPRFIFTSNNFVSDEVFKIWTAEKVNKGTPYFVGQHGNSYGTDRFYQSTIEEVTSDKFLTWGWEGGLSQHTKAFIFKNVSNSRIQNSIKNGLLLVETLLTSRSKVWEQADEYEKYMKEQFRFVASLKSQPRDNLMVRLYGGYADHLGEDDIRWLNFDQQIKLDRGDAPIRELWLKNRIVVHSYDSTGMLETLEANLPTIAFWQNGLDHLVEGAIPYYQLLINAGIVHLTPESAALKVNQVWDDVENWWKSRKVQDAREIFCLQYARTSKKPIRDLKKILLENI